MSISGHTLDWLLAVFLALGTLAFGKYLVRVIAIAALLTLPSLAHAQTCPGFPVRGVQIIDALYNASLAQGTDDQRRELTRTFIEQMVYEMPSDGWTWKSADPGRPPSKDSIARLVSGRLCNYDWQSGATRGRQVQAGTIGEDITGQNPIPVAGVNHLSDSPVIVPPTNPTQPPVVVTQAVDLAPVNQRIDLLSASFDRAFADFVNRDNARAAQLMALDSKLTAHDNEPSWARKVFTNPVVLGVLSGVGGLLTAQQVAK